MDVCKITARCYQYTAIDDCTRWKVVALYPRRTALNTLNFLDQVMERMPFPIQRFQTDRGHEFFAYEVQERLVAAMYNPMKERIILQNYRLDAALKLFKQSL
jgi:transposase-like protein